MKRTNKRAFIFATALSALIFAATGASARGIYDCMSDPVKDKSASNYANYSAEANTSSDTMKSEDPGAAKLKKLSGKGRKFIAHKRRKSPKHRKSKDRTTSSYSMVEPKGA